MIRIKAFGHKLALAFVAAAIIGIIAVNQSVYAESLPIDNIAAAAESEESRSDGEPAAAPTDNDSETVEEDSDNGDPVSEPLKPVDDMSSIMALQEAAAEEAEIDVWSEYNIPRITLETADWAYIDGDKQRGWFVDRNTLRHTDNKVLEYWQLIIYNHAGRKLFEDRLMDIGYTLQYRQLNTKERTVKTYVVAAYDTEGELIEEATDESAVKQVVRPNTMGETVAKAVMKIARKLKK